MKRLICGLGLAAFIALAPQTASADIFDNGGPLCSVLSIGCPPPPPPPPPAPEPVAAPEKPVRHVRKAKVKKAKVKAESAADAPAAEK